MSEIAPTPPLPPFLQPLLADGPPDTQRLEEFLKAHHWPVSDPLGVTFLYRGQAQAVRLRHFAFGLPHAQPLNAIDGTDLWWLRMELPPGSRIEYKFELEYGEGDTQWILDPLNPQHAQDPFGANSVCQAHGYERPDWSQPSSDVRHGTLDEFAIASKAFGESRRVRLYLPARFRRRRQYPLLVVHDGDDFLRFADLHAVLDNLTHRLHIPPMIVALTESPDRLKEYAADRRHATFIAEELVPALASRLPLRDALGARSLMGASFGAVASLHCAWQHPGVFGNLILQSGSFAFSDVGPHHRGETFDPVVRFMNAWRANPGEPATRLYISCGIYESLIWENRAMIAFLQDKGTDIRYREVRDGHNWENWRDRLQDALSWLHPGPLWMIYE
ncbi:MAG: alpha/beta hydrolase-fold protein [Pseudomonadota bacterium]